jgi:hypothetical protein
MQLKRRMALFHESIAMPLTDIKIRQAKPADKPIKLADTAGLYLEVTPSGSKLWR